MSLSKVVNPGPHLIISEKAMNLVLHGISGSIAGCLATFILYPIDHLRTKQQAHAKHDKTQLDKTADSEPSEIEKSKKEHGIRALLNNLLEEEGPLGLYKGVVPSLANTFVNFGVYFFWYEFFKGHFIKDKFSLVGYTITALFAGTITATCTNPFGVLHTRVLLNKEKHMGFLEAIQTIWKNEGIEGFFRGLSASYVLVLNPIIQFVAYEYLKKRFNGRTSSSAVVFLIGAISKALATCITYPYSTLKVNMQASKNKKYTQLELLKHIFESKGMKGFFAGFGAKLSQTVINSALMLVIYERVQAFVKQILIALLSRRRA